MCIDGEFILVFAGGLIEDLRWVEPYLAQATAVIAADGGIRHSLAFGHYPDVLIGDLDSLPEGVAEVMDSWDMEIIRHPVAKDETDLELALLFAAKRYPRHRLYVAGGFGGRLDHTLANILMLAHPALIGFPIHFLNDKETAWLLIDESTIVGQPGDIISLIPLGGPAYVADTMGLRWPLHNETLTFGPARGISNEMTADHATVRLEKGMLWCVHTRHQTTGN